MQFFVKTVELEKRVELPYVGLSIVFGTPSMKVYPVLKLLFVR